MWWENKVAQISMISWNVNGIRSLMRKGFLDIWQKFEPDIMCLQETKACSEQVELLLSGYHQFWHAAEKKGYSGTAIFTRIAPIAHHYGIEGSAIDCEGRVITLEYEKFYLINVYTPNSQRGLTRLDFRVNIWDRAFYDYLVKLETKKPVIFCGDLNVAHKEIDIANPKTNRRNAGFTDEERQSFDRLISYGFVDTFRYFCDEPGHYTWWSHRPGVRQKNIGWRIDYFCVSKKIAPHLVKASIHPQILGSDHCPVGIVIDI